MSNTFKSCTVSYNRVDPSCSFFEKSATREVRNVASSMGFASCRTSWRRGVLEGWGEGLVKRGCARVKAVREMPRPCVKDIVQAQGILPVSKSRLTKSPPMEDIDLLKSIEQLLHKIKANRRREIGLDQ